MRDRRSDELLHHDEQPPKETLSRAFGPRANLDRVPRGRLGRTLVLSGLIPITMPTDDSQPAPDPHQQAHRVVVAATFTDYDLLLIPDQITVTGMVFGIAVGAIAPDLRPMPGDTSSGP